MTGKPILVTGATGQQGGAVARELLAAGHAVRAMTRDTTKQPAHELAAAGAGIVPGDLDDPASLEAALDGCGAAFAVQNTWEAGVEREEEQGLRFAELARRAGIEHFVYSSVGSADRATGVPHFDNKFRVEQHIRELGFPSFVILRPVFFMENLSNPYLFKPGEDGLLAVAMQPATKLQMVAVNDIGRYGRLAFERASELNGQAVDFAGDALTIPEAAAVIAEHAGRPIKHYEVDIADVRSFSEDMALMFEWFERVGYDADIANLEKRFRIRPTPFREWAATQEW